MSGCLIRRVGNVEIEGVEMGWKMGRGKNRAVVVWGPEGRVTQRGGRGGKTERRERARVEGVRFLSDQ